MSVRVALLEREARGSVLRALRLAGAAGEERWTAPRSEDGQTPADIARGAAWIRDRLQGPRTRDSLEALCLDAEGSVCAWTTAQTDDQRVIAALARNPGLGDDSQGGGGGRASSPVAFYAPDAQDSSVQALGVLPTPAKKRGLAGLGASRRAEVKPERLALVAASDVPARLLEDALDALHVRVGSVLTLWHAMAQAWTSPSRSGAEAGSGDPRVVEAQVSTPLTGVVLLDPGGQLLWCWGKAGDLVAAGSMRLRRAGTPGAQAPAEGESLLRVGQSEVGRLVSEWLSWSLELGKAPQRVVLVMPPALSAAHDDDLRPAELGEALGRGWPGAVLDAATHEDPVSATLRRLVDVLEATPPPAQALPGAALVDLSTRPGRAHRAMHLWIAGALALAGGALAASGWQLRREASRAEAVAQTWQQGWTGFVRETFPAALSPRPTLTVVDELEDEVERRERALLVPDELQGSFPVLQELDAISLVLAAPGVRVETITIPSDSTVRVVAIVPTTRDAELLGEGLNRVSGSVLAWTQEISPIPNSTNRRATYTAVWPASARRGSR